MIRRAWRGLNEHVSVLCQLPSDRVEDWIVIALKRIAVVCVGLGACTLMFSGCRAPGSPIARHERTKPPEQAKEGIAERRAFVDEPNVTSEDETGLSLSTASEEPSGTAGDQIDRAAQGRETVERDAAEGARPTQRKPEPQDSMSEDRKDETAGAPNKRSGEDKSSDPADAEPEPGRPSDEVGASTVGSDTHEAPTTSTGGDRQKTRGVDTAEDSDEASSGKPTSGSGAIPPAAQEFGETPGSGNETESAFPMVEDRDDGDPEDPAGGVFDHREGDAARRETEHDGTTGARAPAPSGPALVPVIPARVEKIAPTASEAIVYPEAPTPIEVTTEQVDALRLPATDPKRPIIGIWEQAGGDHSADFAEGNYARTVLVFRTDGVLEVVRWFGAAREIRPDSMLTYTVPTEDRMRLELPHGSRGANPRAYSIPLGGETSVRIEPRIMSFPATLTYTQQDARLVLNGKTYHRSESP